MSQNWQILKKNMSRKRSPGFYSASTTRRLSPLWSQSHLSKQLATLSLSLWKFSGPPLHLQEKLNLFPGLRCLARSGACSWTLMGTRLCQIFRLLSVIQSQSRWVPSRGALPDQGRRTTPLTLFPDQLHSPHIPPFTSSCSSTDFPSSLSGSTH